MAGILQPGKGVGPHGPAYQEALSMRNIRFSIVTATAALCVAVASAEARTTSLPAGTVIPVRFETSVSSAQSRPEDRVLATVRQDVIVDGRVVIPAGSELRGYVVDAKRSGRVKGRAELAVDFNRLRINGHNYDVDTRQLSWVAPATHGRDAKIIGGGAGAGAIIGAIADGKEGAAKGALIGGATGTGVVLTTRGKEVKVPAGSRYRLRLARPLVVQ